MVSPPGGRKVIATNRKARHEYHILDEWEAGLVLTGSEVKSLRDGKVSFQDSFARVEGGEVWLHSLHISPYLQANRQNHDPLRPRKLLLRRQEIRKLIGKVEEKGLTLVPLEIYFQRGYAKVRIALARGKQLHDKREALKKRDQEREARRALGAR
ncbi:MAG: SsrA-binding protein SmpB [Gemmatimonadales bacterium]|nr:MAG: SsrA-binding protein SmpB [Gemmatimonadales bacterium]